MWSNYTDVFEYSDLLSNVYNSLIISGFATIIGIICGLLTAYTIARYEMKKLALTYIYETTSIYNSYNSFMVDVQKYWFTEFAFGYYSSSSCHYHTFWCLDHGWFY